MRTEYWFLGSALVIAILIAATLNIWYEYETATLHAKHGMTPEMKQRAKRIER